MNGVETNPPKDDSGQDSSSASEKFSVGRIQQQLSVFEHFTGQKFGPFLWNVVVWASPFFALLIPKIASPLLRLTNPIQGVVEGAAYVFTILALIGLWRSHKTRDRKLVEQQRIIDGLRQQNEALTTENEALTTEKAELFTSHDLTNQILSSLEEREFNAVDLEVKVHDAIVDIIVSGRLAKAEFPVWFESIMRAMLMVVQMQAFEKFGDVICSLKCYSDTTLAFECIFPPSLHIPRQKRFVKSVKELDLENSYAGIACKTGETCFIPDLSTATNCPLTAKTKKKLLNFGLQTVIVIPLGVKTSDVDIHSSIAFKMDFFEPHSASEADIREFGNPVARKFASVCRVIDAIKRHRFQMASQTKGSQS